MSLLESWFNADAVTVGWAAFIAFCLMMYAVLDGFDLGVGMLLAGNASEHTRRRMVRSIATVWDGNETWLVMAAVALFGGFPLAYASATSGLYAPLILMLLAMIVRGVVFEFHGGSSKPRRWEYAMAGASAVAAYLQGAVIGAVWLGLAEPGRALGGTLSVLRGFPVLCGAMLLLLDLALGAAWLMEKLEPRQRPVLRRVIWRAGMGLVVVTVTVFTLAPMVTPLLGSPAPDAGKVRVWAGLGVAVVCGVLMSTGPVAKWGNRGAFLGLVATVAVLFTGAAWLQFPAILPGVMTVWEARSPSASQLVLLVGVLLATPVVLAYTAYGYWVFRGPTLLKDGASNGLHPDPDPRRSSGPGSDAGSADGPTHDAGPVPSGDYRATILNPLPTPVGQKRDPAEAAPASTERRESNGSTEPPAPAPPPPPPPGPPSAGAVLLWSPLGVVAFFGVVNILGGWSGLVSVAVVWAVVAVLLLRSQAPGVR